MVEDATLARLKTEAIDPAGSIPVRGPAHRDAFNPSSLARG
jgi:hypothetical protein